MDIRDEYIIEESCCVLNSGEAIESEMDNLHVRLYFNLSKEKGIKHNS
jgi:hypothetical protein